VELGADSTPLIIRVEHARLSLNSFLFEQIYLLLIAMMVLQLSRSEEQTNQLILELLPPKSPTYIKQMECSLKQLKAVKLKQALMKKDQISPGASFDFL
jgi:membrane-associated PAP2 superfamily phosphatase